MEENFIQKTMFLDPEVSGGKLKVETLCELIVDHPYKEMIFKEFEIESIKEEYISIDYIDVVYKRILTYSRDYHRYPILAQVKDINVYEDVVKEKGFETKNIVFDFEEYVDVDEVKKDLKAIAIYDAKNTFLDEYDMTKYANYLFKSGQAQLANANIEFFKKLALTNEEYNKHRSYRLVEHKGKVYLRGITSFNKYYEYGVDFTFVIAMLLLHNNMKKNKGTEYKIKSVAVNESKLDMIVSEKYLKDAKTFGEVATAIKISTNDLGQGALSLTSIISVGKVDENGFFLFPKETEANKNKLSLC
ncbi:hypothetical protein [Myroides sp. WP-1]|uniref:hypothetical protein n=1 Tax=Myroides sp. WP-1 TaxID=2759944 RepID=UPI0015F91CE4|nr:hypothetical protein [Myroides sp. WP-1]MBB1140154.1 hypothetical protein [Myroides sp. WP-1]